MQVRCCVLSVHLFTYRSCRKAYTQYLLKGKVAEGVRGLKKHGAKDKIDNQTCLICLAAPGTYHEETSIDNKPVFWELSRLLGVSSMHLKVRIMELIWINLVGTYGIASA